MIDYVIKLAAKNHIVLEYMHNNKKHWKWTINWVREAYSGFKNYGQQVTMFRNQDLISKRDHNIAFDSWKRKEQRNDIRHKKLRMIESNSLWAIERDL